MDPKKTLKNAYKDVPLPKAEDVLPKGAFEQPEEKPVRHFNRRRLYTAITAAALVVVMILGVFGVMMIQSAQEEHGVESTSAQSTGGSPAGAESTGSSGASGSGEISYADGVIPSKEGSGKNVYSGDYLAAGGKGGDYPTEAFEEPAEDALIKFGEGYEMALDGDKSYLPAAKAGTLTASEWKDIKNLAEWLGNIQKQGWSGYLTGRGLYSDNVIEVKVSNGDAAIYNQKVELFGADGKLLWTAKTDISGYAYLFYKSSDKGILKIKAGESEKEFKAGNGQQKFDSLELELDVDKTEIKQLDLMLMVDTTGSMSDELEYLKAELADMVERVAKADEELSIRVSVNFYRDEGDDYVVKYYDFRSDISECVAQIDDEHAAGGGDWPEAVHTALDNAINGHQWRGNAVKICFLVLDAPPHDEQEIQGINADIEKSLIAAAANGIRIVPVASSGVDTETEVLLRSFALMTGGSYIYLTNDSGVGGHHQEATVSQKNVEPLNECMIRVVCEACGIDYTPEYTFNGNGGDEPNAYAITYDFTLAELALLTDRPNGAYPGETVEIRTIVLTNADIAIYANGEKTERTHYGSDYWGFSFVMPDRSVEITVEFLGEPHLLSTASDRIICDLAGEYVESGTTVEICLEKWFFDKHDNVETYEVVSYQSPDGNEFFETAMFYYDEETGLFKSSFTMPDFDVTLDIYTENLIYD